jgi:hypothetical protein
MTWNYRIIRHVSVSEVWYAVHEVYYDSFGNPVACSEDPVFPMGYALTEITDDLNRYHKALSKPILDYSTFAQNASLDMLM